MRATQYRSIYDAASRDPSAVNPDGRQDYQRESSREQKNDRLPPHWLAKTTATAEVPPAGNGAADNACHFVTHRRVCVLEKLITLLTPDQQAM